MREHIHAPWQASEQDDHWSIHASDPDAPAMGNRVCTLPLGEQGAARARLIAAGPDFDAAADLAIPLLQEDRDAFYECHTVQGNPLSLTDEEALVIAGYDMALYALRAAQAKAAGEDAPDEPAYGQCPFDSRLARTPYLVLPKLALQVMPMTWRLRLEALLAEMEAQGLQMPEYHVLRDDGPGERYTRASVVNEDTGFLRIMGGEEDPWADYRHNQRAKVAALCPGFKA